MTVTTIDQLLDTREELTEREAGLMAHICAGVASANDDAGHRRPAAFWRAVADLLIEHVNSVSGRLDILEGRLPAPGGPDGSPERP